MRSLFLQNFAMKRSEMSSENKPDRKTVEKNRRIVMKGLCSKLVSVIPDHHFTPAKEFLSQQDQIKQAAAYIKILRERVEELRRKKAVMNINSTNYGTKNVANNMGEKMLPILEIKDLGSDLEVGLICGPNENFKLHKIISIIEEEGAQVLTVSISTIGDRIFHTIHAQVKISRIGVDTLRTSERIQALIS